ncbi:OmpA family protein [Rurimicrobium arvi]|uniref:OmpA family protein n=1 Tax=Rurimicrobium arvi TaxID=2049916 RepID=UPI0031D31C76
MTVSLLQRILSILSTCLLLVTALQLRAQKGYDTVKIYFPINITRLDTAATKKLDSIARFASNRIMLVYGYADYLGYEPSNMDLAITRAENVKQYLIDHKVDRSRFLVCEGIGQVSRNVNRSPEGFPEDRRVDVFIRRGNDAPPPQTKDTTASAPKKGMKVMEFTEEARLVPVKPFEEEVDVVPGGNTAYKRKPQKPLTPEQVKENGIFNKLGDLQPNDVMRVQNIYFLPTRHIITKESVPIVLQLLATLKNFPNLAIRIEGHVCCVRGDSDAMDTDTYELSLSINRARHIYEFLIANGISADRLEYIGFARRRPIIPFEKTEQDAQVNRRVEIRVLRN